MEIIAAMPHIYVTNILNDRKLNNSHVTTNPEATLYARHTNAPAWMMGGWGWGLNQAYSLLSTTHGHITGLDDGLSRVSGMTMFYTFWIGGMVSTHRLVSGRAAYPILVNKIYKKKKKENKEIYRK